MADFLAHGLVDAAFFVPDLAYVFFLTLAVVQALRTLDKQVVLSFANGQVGCMMAQTGLILVGQGAPVEGWHKHLAVSCTHGGESM
jgi:hypothetical protein